MTLEKAVGYSFIQLLPYLFAVRRMNISCGCDIPLYGFLPDREEQCLFFLRRQMSGTADSATLFAKKRRFPIAQVCRPDPFHRGLAVADDPSCFFRSVVLRDTMKNALNAFHIPCGLRLCTKEHTELLFCIWR